MPEYAQLVVAAERGTAREVLMALALPRGAVLRLTRLWAKKTMGSAALGKRVRAAIQRAREE